MLLINHALYAPLCTRQKAEVGRQVAEISEAQAALGEAPAAADELAAESGSSVGPRPRGR